MPEEIQGGTFTVTNYGVFGNIIGTPIINQPQVAILGVGAIKKRPVVLTDAAGNDSIALRSMVYLTLAFDHRIIDGALGGQFLAKVVSNLEQYDFTRVF
jgi:2-oxoglutarate dehydrogenase E2 component (dihydrolipoamide succinyltransferase)